MAEKDAMDDRRRALEEQYFKERETELIAKMRQRLASEEERRELSDEAGTVDDGILDELQSMGFTRQTVSLVHLVPLLQVAWADCGVSAAERERILEAAAARGIHADDSAHSQLLEWMEVQPSEQFFERCLRVIKAMLQAATPEGRDVECRDLMGLAEGVASVSGGIFGFGSKVSAKERAVLRSISEEIQGAHTEAAARLVEST